MPQLCLLHPNIFEFVASTFVRWRQPTHTGETERRYSSTWSQTIGKSLPCELNEYELWEI